MRAWTVAVVMCVLGAGCAEKSLLREEDAVLKSKPVTSTSYLKTLAEHSEALSMAYRKAAHEATEGQNVAAVLTYLAAGSFVVGAVGSASDVALANRGLVGVASTSVASRTVSKDTIKGIYIASKRMNCVATTANMGRFLLARSTGPTKKMARAATYGAVEEIRIITREALVRDVADFTAIRDDLLAGVGGNEEGARVASDKSGGVPRTEIDFIRLNQYLGLLDNCLLDAARVTSVATIPKDGS